MQDPQRPSRPLDHPASALLPLTETVPGQRHLAVMVPRGQCFADAPNYSSTMPSNPCSAASSCALAAASAARNRFFTLDDDGLGVVHRQTPRPQRGCRRGLWIILLMWNDRKLGLREFSAVVFGYRWRGGDRVELRARCCGSA